MILHPMTPDLSPEEVGIIIGMTPRGVRKCLRRGHSALRGWQMHHGEWRIYRESVAEYKGISVTEIDRLVQKIRSQHVASGV